MAASTTLAAAKPKSTKSGSKASSKAAPKPNAAHPSWKDIIRACITNDTSNARSGVSRSTIKKYAEVQYKMEINAVANSQLNRAIAHGAEKGIFSLPKGPSGKVKLAKKPKADASKENAKPPSKTAVKKTQVKGEAPTKSKAPVKPAVKKPSTKTAPKTSTKPSSAKKTAKKVTSAKNAAKAAVTKQKAKSAKSTKPLKSKPKATKAAV